MKTRIVLLAAFLMLAFSSCGTYTRLAYLQDMAPDVSYSVPDRPDVRISKGDQITILVSCSSPTLAAPFNVVNGNYSLDASSGEQSLSVPAGNKPLYDVGMTGEINFPVLGKIKVEGMTLQQLKDKLEDYLISRRYIKDPVVNVEFANFQITMLGEIRNVGNYQISNGKMNLFEALALAGDMTDNAMRDNVWVIRTTPGKRKLYTVNMKSKDCYYSPVFYLQQNDMIYVPARDDKKDAKMENVATFLQVALTAASSALYMLLLIAMYAS